MLTRVHNSIVYSENVRLDAKKHLKSTDQSRFMLREDSRIDRKEKTDMIEEGNEFMRAAIRHNAAIKEARLKNSRSADLIFSPAATEEK